VRTLKLRQSLLPSFRRYSVIPGQPFALLIAKTMRELRDADDLPGPEDLGYRIIPVGQGWQRRIGTSTLALAYTFDPTFVTVRALQNWVGL
jgi:hypothetical protein